MKYIEQSGNLFDATTSLAHCVSSDLKMGAGIALEFRNKYGRVNELAGQCPTIGDICVLQSGDIYIYYLVTKKLYWNKPTYQDLKYSLSNLKSHMEKNNIKSVSMPKIGCGLDKLDWKRVSRIINDIFQDSDIEITIYTN